MKSIRRRRITEVHPGEILREEFMRPVGLSSYKLAKELHITVPRINEIVRERRAITADTAVRLSRFFGMPPEFWLNLQADYDIRNAIGKLGTVQIKPRVTVAIA